RPVHALRQWRVEDDVRHTVRLGTEPRHQNRSQLLEGLFWVHALPPPLTTPWCAPAILPSPSPNTCPARAPAPARGADRRRASRRRGARRARSAPTPALHSRRRSGDFPRPGARTPPPRSADVTAAVGRAQTDRRTRRTSRRPGRAPARTRPRPGVVPPTRAPPA